MHELALLPALAPALGAAVLVGGMLRAERPSERTISRVAVGSLGLSLLASFGVFALWAAYGPAQAPLGLWWRAGRLEVELSLRVDGAGVTLSLLAAGWALLAGKAAVTYLHREAGYLRFQALVGVLAAGMQLIALGGDLLVIFVGWELAGVASALLIAWRFPRADGAWAGARAFLTNRVGDAAFVLAMAALWSGGGTLALPELGAGLAPWQAGAAFVLLTVAAAVKGGQLPFSPWLSRSMEGPTLSSALFYGAVMVQAGPFLVLRAAPLAVVAPSVMALPVVIGVLTWAYGWLVAIAQNDVKSSYVHASMSQVGVTFALAAAAPAPLALLHLVGHASLRGWQLATSPSFRQQVAGEPAAPAPAWLRARPALQVAARGRLWLDELHAEVVVEPARRLARDLSTLDAAVLDPLSELPSPAARVASSLAAWEEQRLAVDPLHAAATGTRGLVARALGWVSDRVHDIEQRYVLPWFSTHLPRAIRALGRVLLRVEPVLAEGWFIPALVLLTLALVTEGA